MNNSIIDQVNEIIECPICTEVMQDPRILPCVHTYCFKCLEKLIENSQLDAKIPCPVCRTDFAVPKEGAADIPKNFFIEKMIGAQKMKDRSKEVDCVCEACAADDAQTVEFQYCLDCEQNFCKHCAAMHGKMKVSERHEIRELAAMRDEAPPLKKKSVSCGVHAGRALDVFCEKCQRIMCLVCYTKDHQQHSMCDVETRGRDLRAQIEAYLLSLRQKRENYDLNMNKLRDREDRLTLNFRDIESQVIGKGEELKQIIDETTTTLIRKLDFLKNQELDKSHKLIKVIDKNASIVAEFIKYNEKLVQNGSDPDVIQNFKDLNQRASDLLDKDEAVGDGGEEMVVHKCCNSYTAASRYIQHFMGDIVEVAAKNYVPNKIGCNLCDQVKESNDLNDLNDPTQSNDEPSNIDINKLSLKPAKSKTFSKNPVGMATLNNRTYLIFRQCPNIEVYDSDSLMLHKSVPVPGLEDPCDIAAIGTHLLVSEFNSDKIVHVVDSGVDSSVDTWQCGYESITRVSATCKGELLVVSRQWNKLVVYAVDGTPVKQISLPTNVKYVHQAYHLSDDAYLLYHGRENTFKITVVNGDGEKRHSFGGTSYSPLQKSSQVVPLRVGEDFCYLVLDGGDRRFYLLNENLDYLREVGRGEEGAFVSRMVVDAHRRLYLLDTERRSLVVMKVCSE